MRANQAHHRGATMCRVLGVSPSGYNTHRRHFALGSLSPNDFERAAAKAASGAPGNDDRLDRVDLEAFRTDEPEAPNHPPGRPSTSVFGNIFLPSAFAYPRAGSESHNLSTRSG